MQNLENKYPWLRMCSNSIEDYIPPDYYDKLLKEYNFLGKSDLDYFNLFLRHVSDKNIRKALELGSGSGRATDVFVASSTKFSHLDLVDLSNDMVRRVKNKYKKNKKISIYKSDNLEYIKKTQNVYDLVYSLWSFSHSVHQHLIDKNKKSAYIQKIIKKFIQGNMNSGARFFLIHFDSLSEEQKILMRQWRKFFPVFKSKTKQSPSKLILDKIFKSMEGKEIKNLIIRHLKGDPIVYNSIENALETFMNFHMETEFNRHENVQGIINELTEDIKRCKRGDGKYYIGTGCFIYIFEKI